MLLVPLNMLAEVLCASLAFYCLLHNVSVEERAPPDRHEDEVCRWLLTPPIWQSKDARDPAWNLPG